MTTSQAFDKICSYQSDQFREWFGDMPFKKSSAKLYGHKLPRPVNDKEIMAEMNPGEVSIGEIYHCLESLNPKGWGIFYVKDTDGVLRAVGVDWDGFGWSIDAREVTYPFGCDDGFRVFSRNSVLKPSASEQTPPSDSLSLHAAIELCQKNGLIVSKPLN